MRPRTFSLIAAISGLAMIVGTSTATGATERPNDAETASEVQNVASPLGAAERASAPDQANRPDRFAPCVRGVAHLPEFDGHPVLESGAFSCERTDLLSYLPPDEIGGGFEVGTGRGSDVWGWTDPETKREYVLAGKENGTAIVDISKPKRPVYLAELPTSSDQNLIWRDIKIFADHAFIVSESPGHGMQVLDLTRLRDIDPADAPVTLDEDALYDGFERSHNLWINEDSGFAYALGQREDARGCARSMHMIDINDPKNPTFAGCFDQDGNTHDALCVIYEGPDTRFTGREICVISSPGDPTGNTVVIADVTDKANPVMLANVSYPNSAFSHQGDLLDGHRFYLHGSESTTRTPQVVDIFDFADLTDPQHIGTFETPAQSTHHNLYQKNRFIYQSNYTSGLRVYDSRNVAGGELREVASFDVYPPNDDPGFGFGTWSNYAQFDSGVVAVHGYQGLWLVKPRLGERVP